MMNVVVYERGSYSKSEASVSGCFACGGCLSVRTGDFLRCMSCCAENYCPLTTAPAEERVRQWFHRRGCIATNERAVYGRARGACEERGGSLS